MKVQLGHIVQNLFHADSLDDVPVSRLQEMAETHPYFGAGHLLLSQKLKHQQSSGFEAQVQRTALYFHDPLWLHWQLGQQATEVAVPETPAVSAAVAEPEIQSDLEVDEKGSLVQPSDYQPDDVPEIQPEPESKPDAQPGTTFEPGQEPAKTAEPEEGTGSIYEPDSIEPPAQPNPEADPAPPAHEEPQTEQHLEPKEEPQPQPEPVEEPASEPPVTLPGPDTQEQPPITEPVTAETEIQVQAETPNSKSQTPNPKPEFEAYHTIDYFASQGIKISNEVQPGDRLGKQLKSFTEWLKTMKRLPQTTPDQAEDSGDQQIRRIAAGSLVEKEVVTETMAEVLLKQDKRDEAIAIYEKLSLLDPSKRAYFAAKIENLKVN